MSFNIFIMRHGAAAFVGQTDAERPLTPFGELQAASVGEKLKLYSLVDCWASPYLRAQQTKQIVLQSSGHHVNDTTDAGITPSGNESVVGEALKANGKDVIIVSHMPFVSKLTQYLCGKLHNFNTADCAVLSVTVQGEVELVEVISAS